MNKLEHALALLKRPASSPSVIASAIEESMRQLTNDELKEIISKA